MLDLVLRGGEVVDGTGAPRRRVDLGIKDGRVAEIGSIKDRDARQVDVDGLVVCPGFIDLHTHFDAQAFWDPYLTPSSTYGVTTVIGGNCGFSIAPLSPESADYLMRMLARVEGMPLESLREGVPWNWSTTDEYLDLLESRLAVNTGFMVGHSALRRFVMGPEAVERAATPTEIDHMAQLVRDGLAAGGFGFSSSWGPAHLDGDGVPVPSRHATADELLSLSAVCRDFEGVSLEFIPQRGPGLDDESKDLMAEMSKVAQQPLNWNSMRVSADNLDQVYSDLEADDLARSLGGNVVALTMPVKSRGRFSFETGFVLDGLPGWGPTMALALPERRQALMDPSVRRMLSDAATQASDAMRWITDWGSKRIAETFNPDTKHYQGRTVSDIAKDEGKQPFDALLDVVCADDLRATFSLAASEMSRADWDASIAVWRDGRAIIGASDAGAHLDFTGNFDYAVYVLENAVRKHQAIGFEEAISYLTDAPARFYGIRHRGRLEPGFWADMVVLDEQAVASTPLTTRFDLPAGAGRLYSEPEGVAGVYVNGTAILADGEPTGALPGIVMRSGRDTEAGRAVNRSSRS